MFYFVHTEFDITQLYINSDITDFDITGILESVIKQIKESQDKSEVRGSQEYMCKCTTINVWSTVHLNLRNCICYFLHFVEFVQ